ncbi:MAG: magnesium/cobalt transporter CorA [Pirellulales bacterium]
MAKYRSRKKRRHFHRRTPPGAPPGTLVVDPAAPRPVVSVIAYGPEGFAERQIDDIGQVREFLGQWPITWIDVDGLGDTRTVCQLGEMLGLHQLALEDVVNVHQRAKVEPYGDHLFIVTRMIRMTDRLETEQISLFVGPNFVLTFQEHRGDCFDPVRERLRQSHGGIRETDTGFLAYALVDSVIDGYYPVLEQYGERLDRLEDDVLQYGNHDIIARIHEVKSDLFQLRRAIWPHRDAVNELVRDPHPLITGDTRVYLRDCYDHVVQLIDLVETYRELGADLRDLHLATISNRTNEIMKVLTVIATVFMPLTFIAGLYGMNFHTDVSPWNMPELTWYLGYPFALALMGLVAGWMLLFFRRRGWLGSAMENKEKRGQGPGVGGQERDQGSGVGYLGGPGDIDVGCHGWLAHPCRRPAEAGTPTVSDPPPTEN